MDKEQEIEKLIAILDEMQAFGIKKAESLGTTYYSKFQNNWIARKLQERGVGFVEASNMPKASPVQQFYPRVRSGTWRGSYGGVSAGKTYGAVLSVRCFIAATCVCWWEYKGSVTHLSMMGFIFLEKKRRKH